MYLGDVMAQLLGSGKRRSSKPGMSRALRQLAEAVLACGDVLHGSGSRSKPTRRTLPRGEGYAVRPNSGVSLVSRLPSRGRPPPPVPPALPSRAPRAAGPRISQRTLSLVPESAPQPPWPGRVAHAPPRSAAQNWREATAKDGAQTYREVEVIPGTTLAETIVVNQPTRHHYISLLVVFITFVLGLSEWAVTRPPILEFP